MIRLLVYLLLFGTILFFLSWLGKKQGAIRIPAEGDKPARKLRAKANPRELWIQVYETATLDEARLFQARIQEEEVECIIYEQGKKDIHGNSLSGIGIAVPKTMVAQAQSIIARMPG